MTTLDPPTLPLPAITLNRAAVRDLRRQGTRDRRRTEDLRRAEHPSTLERDEALVIVARMSARPETEQLQREYLAIRRLMRYHEISPTMIRDAQRRLSGSW